MLLLLGLLDVVLQLLDGDELAVCLLNMLVQGLLHGVVADIQLSELLCKVRVVACLGRATYTTKWRSSGTGTSRHIRSNDSIRTLRRSL